VGARLLAHAGSLVNLAKLPASTIQILGAEKALFRALKTKGNTPKYGLIYHSSFIGRAAAKNKGRISRNLANKIALAARIDHFSAKVFQIPKFSFFISQLHDLERDLGIKLKSECSFSHKVLNLRKMQM
jgi:RNA processing factor Prp31